MSVGKCDRCKTVIEPMLSTQWFARMRPLADKAIAAIHDGQIDIQPENSKRTLLHWLENIHDWCVSRQLWWGHRIPAWYRRDTGEVIVARTDEEARQQAGGAEIDQDNDVLDTWFSSGLWPFSTLGWPDQTPDFARYYPTSLMIMGYEILFLWCARMTMLGLEFAGGVPFRNVYIHGIVRDADKQKMSKTRGNTVDPLDITAKYGTDAVRMALMTSAAPGADIVWTEDKLPSSRAFANKIWNASRFLFLNMERAGVEPSVPGPGPIEALEDQWIWSRFNRAAETVNRSIEQYRFHEAAQTMWHFFWSDFCDWYIELKKLRFRDESGLDDHWRNILRVFEMALRLLHPAMPFITEELWQRLQTEPGRSPCVMPFPRFDPALDHPAAEAEMARLQEIILAARQIRADLNRPPKETIRFAMEAPAGFAATAAANAEAIRKLANAEIESHAAATALKLLPQLDAEVSGEQKARAAREAEQLEKVIANSQRQLSDETFMSRAPAHVVDGIRAKLAEYESRLEALRR
jgi:valyl-tRNA synthetase